MVHTDEQPICSNDNCVCCIDGNLGKYGIIGVFMLRDLMVSIAIVCLVIVPIVFGIALTGFSEGEVSASKKICNETQWKSPSCITLKNKLLGVSNDTK